jgi:hypothetical protein
MVRWQKFSLRHNVVPQVIGAREVKEYRDILGLLAIKPVFLNEAIIMTKRYFNVAFDEAIVGFIDVLIGDKVQYRQ